MAYMVASGRMRLMRELFSSFKKVFAIAFFSALGALLWFHGTKMTQPTNVSFIFQFSRLFTAMVGVSVLGERLSIRENVGVALAILGGFIITYTSGVNLAFANLILLASAFFYAISYILAKMYIRDLNLISMATGRSIFISLMLLAYSSVLGKLRMDLQYEAIGWGMLGAFFGPFLTILLFYSALDRLEISKVSAILSTQPFFTVLFSIVIFNVIPDFGQLVGGAMATVGIMMLTGSSGMGRGRG